MEFERWRREFPSCESSIHLNHSGVSPVPTRVVHAVQQYIADVTIVDETREARRTQRLADVRASFARLIGADAREVAFVSNTSEGISFIASAIRWSPGDNVVTVDGDYPTNIYPWWGQRRFGVEVRAITPRGGRFGVDDIHSVMDARTRAVAISAVDWQSGFRADLGSIGGLCRERGALFCVDGIQAVGALQIDVARDHVDCLAAGSHKWLLAPHGCGGLFVSQRIVEQLEPVVLGWNSVDNAEAYLPYHFDLRHDAARFEPGSYSYLGVYALGAALELLHEVGAPAVEARIRDLTAQLADGLRSRGAEIVSPMGERERSGILTFRFDTDPAGLVEALRTHGVICRVRAGGIRLAPHFYISDQQISRFFAVLDEVRRAATCVGA